MLPVPPSQSPAKHCHSRLAHTAAMLMVRERTGAHVECLLMTVSVCGYFTSACLFVSETIMCNEYYYSDRLLTGHTERNTVVMQLSYRLPPTLPTTHTQSSCQDWAESVPLEHTDLLRLMANHSSGACGSLHFL